MVGRLDCKQRWDFKQEDRLHAASSIRVQDAGLSQQRTHAEVDVKMEITRAIDTKYVFKTGRTSSYGLVQRQVPKVQGKSPKEQKNISHDRGPFSGPCNDSVRQSPFTDSLVIRFTLLSESKGQVAYKKAAAFFAFGLSHPRSNLFVRLH